MQNSLFEHPASQWAAAVGSAGWPEVRAEPLVTDERDSQNLQTPVAHFQCGREGDAIARCHQRDAIARAILEKLSLDNDSRWI